MTKDEIKELQANLISLVPSDIRKAKELTKSDKILLGQLVFLYGMNKAKENGYVFRSNALLKEDTQLSKRSVSLAISHLIAYGAINRTVGSRADGASVYTLNFALPQMGESSPNTPKVALKSSPKNHPYVSRAEVEAMIEGLRAEYEQQISELRDELATLKGMKSAKVALKSSPINGVSSPKSSPQIQNSEKETTNHSVPEGNYREGNIYTRPDGKKNDEVVETVGSVCDFQKNRVEGEQSQAEETTPNANANEIDPLNVEDDEAFLSTLEGNLRNENTTLHLNEVIDLSKRVAEIFTERVDDYKSPTSKQAFDCFALLVNHCKDLDSLAQLEREVNGNLHQTNRNSELISTAITIRRAAIEEEAAETALISTPDTAEVQTTIDDEKTQQGASQRANQGSGEIPSIPMKEETPQTSENKASGSVSAPQMGKLSTQTEKTRQTRPDEAREAMTVDIPTDRMLTKFVNLNEVYDPLLHNGESEAEKVAIQVCKRCEKIETIESVNWCLTVIPETLNRHGKILGSRGEIYLNAAVNALNRLREELLAA